MELFRSQLDRRFFRTPGDISIVMHPSAFELSLAQPWLPLARRATAPAARRYLAGWFNTNEIHVLSPTALQKRASPLPESLEALRLTPMHEYVHLVVGANNPKLPPPFSPRSFARYLRWAWLAEGAATHFSGQALLLRPAIVRRMREGRPPSFPPAARDAQLLGGTIFGLVEEAYGPASAVEMVSRLDAGGGKAAIERIFARSPREVEPDWREYLLSL
ncbi:MAG: hypothetical protein QOH13_906 [Thermoleophilaceae bacterium]|nr:hypothetical protein [Thermoleophilaceae bacterium]